MKYKCDTCDRVEETEGEIDDKTLEGEGWYLGPTVTLCPDHNEDSDDTLTA